MVKWISKINQFFSQDYGVLIKNAKNSVSPSLVCLPLMLSPNYVSGS